MLMSCTRSVIVILCFGLFFNVQGYDDDDLEFLLSKLLDRLARVNCPADAPCLSQDGSCGSGPDYCGAGCRAGPCTSSDGGVSRRGGFQGEATHYSVSAGYTACGTRHGDGEMVAALNRAQFDPHTPGGNPNRNTLCNRRVRVSGPRGTAIVRIVDRCPGCKFGDLDLSNAAFQAVVGNMGIGRARISWNWA